MAVSFIPSIESEVVTWCNHFAQATTATPVAFGLTAAQATQFSDANDIWQAAYVAAANPTTRTKATVAAKKTALAVVKTIGNSLGKMVQANLNVTDEQKIGLGLTVRKPPAPRPVPTTAPNVKLLSMMNRLLKIGLSDSGEGKRKKAAAAQGALVFSYVGATPPQSIEGWKLEGQATRTTFDIVFSSSVPAGSTVWIVAQWYTYRGQTGPACPPAAFQIGGGVSTMGG